MSLLQCSAPSLIGSTYPPSTHRHGALLGEPSIRARLVQRTTMKQGTPGGEWRNEMDIVRIVVLLLHPLLATGLLGWIWWQYSWRKKSHELKGESRKKALTHSMKNMVTD